MYYLFLFPLVALAIRTFIGVYSSSLLDFSMYLSATKYFLAGQNPYLAITPQVYPPAFLYLITPFALIPEEIAKAIWTSLSLIAFFLSLHLLLKRFSLKTQIFIALFSLQLFPVKFALAQGQINIFVFLGFVLLYRFYKNNRDFLAGLTLAIITIMKLNPILFVLYFLVLKRYRLIFFSIVLLILLNFAVDALTSHNLTQSFLQATLFRSINPPLGYYNQSLPALLYRLDLSTFSPLFSIIILSVTTYSFFKNITNTKKFFSLFLLTLLLISPITWQHYLFWSLPAFFYLLFDSQKPSLILITFALVLININIKDPIPFSNNQLFFSHATIGLLLLYALTFKSKIKP